MSTPACDSDFRGRVFLVNGTCRLLAILLAPISLFGVELPNASLLPPPATRMIRFGQDVAPLFEANCYRCHGEEKPKSDFSLATRERALKGGWEGVDIVPGHSAESPLIHYVARRVEDMEMPPEGSGTPLTDEEIGILRAWIDQGAVWADTEAATFKGGATPSLLWTVVSGEEGTFRELESVYNEWTGGLMDFGFVHRQADGAKVEMEGRALAPHDYRLSLGLSQPDLGFVRTGAEQWRRYYSGVGGYNALASPAFYTLGDDLALDIGKVWLDVGLTLPHAPSLILGYAYRYKDGTKSTLQWGLAANRATYPASKDIDEGSHTMSLDLEYEIAGWRLDERAQMEWYRNQTVRHNTLLETPIIQRTDIDGTTDSVRGANTFRVDKQFTDWWQASAAHFYSRLDGDSSYAQVTLDGSGNPTIGPFWSAQRIEIDSESHVLSLSSSFQPIRRLSLSLGGQYEHSRQEGFGPVNLDVGDPSNPGLAPITVDSNLRRHRWSEFGALRYRGVPFTVVFADARLDQEEGSQFEQELDDSASAFFLRDTAFATRRGDWRVGLQISRWRQAAVNVHYRGQFNKNDYDHLQDNQFGSSEGYSAFVRNRDIDKEGVHVSLTLKPWTWFRARLQYDRTETSYHVVTDPTSFPATPGGGLDAGLTRSTTYTLGLSVRPWSRFSVGASGGYNDATTSTARNGIASVVDDSGYSWWARGTATYVLSEKDDVFATYEYWRSDFGQDHFSAGLPLGSDYRRQSIQVGLTRRWSDRLRSTLRYGYYDHQDAATGGARDYRAHGLFASLSYNWE